MKKLYSWFSVVHRLLGNFSGVKAKQLELPHVLNSQISHPELVNVTAVICNSKLGGPIQVGEKAKLTEVWLQGAITIGRFSSLNGPNTDIHSLHNPVVIGNFCSIARNVAIQEYNHIFDRCASYFMVQNVFGGSYKADTYSKGAIKIGNDVWIGTQSVILSGVEIGDGAIIGANSVVTSDIPPYAVAMGSPARVIRYRFEPEVIEQLLSLEWWLWPEEKILRNRGLFEGPLTTEKLVGVE